MASRNVLNATTYICSVCGKEYAPSSYNSKVCSDKCRQIHLRNYYYEKKNAVNSIETKYIKIAYEGMNTDFSYGDVMYKKYTETDKIKFPSWVRKTRRA